MNKIKEAVKEAKKKQLDLDTFGKLMDKVIDESDVAMLVAKKAFAKEWQVKSSHGCGAGMDFYLLLNALKPIFLQLYEDMQGEIDAEKLAGELCGILKEELIDAVKEETEE